MSNVRRDLTGQKFGRWTVIGYDHTKNSHAYWWARCECGTVKSLEGAMLTRGNSLSCGCLKRDVVSYGLLPEYNAWRDMIRRCYNQSADAYENYGGRGITVCPEWLSSFEAFLSDMGKRRSDKHSLDRIDNSKGYEKANCRWVARDEQSSKKRGNVVLTYNGQSMRLSEWSRKTGIKFVTLQMRVRLGWPVDRILSQPVRPREQARLITYNGQTMTVQQWAEITGIAAHTIRFRLDVAGWPVERALTEPVRRR